MKISQYSKTDVKSVSDWITLPRIFEGIDKDKWELKSAGERTLALFFLLSEEYFVFKVVFTVGFLAQIVALDILTVH